MSDPDPEAWTDGMTARERVRAVVELLDEPASIEAVRKRADVSWSTANRELEQMVNENWVTSVEVDGTERYRLNPVRLLFDEIERLIEGHSREELESELESMLEERQRLQDDYEASSSDELRKRLAEPGRSAEEVREVRNAASTWRAVETEIRLYRHALQLYDDVTRLQGDDAPAEVAP